MKRGGHCDTLPANAVPEILWNLFQAWRVARPMKRRPTRRRRAQDVPLPFERPSPESRVRA